MKYILIIMGLLLLNTAYSQNYCEWNHRKSELDFPIWYKPLTTGWSLYAPTSDEFNGTTLDPSKWGRRHACKDNTYMASVYVDDTINSHLSDGKLILRATERTVPDTNCFGRNYNTAYVYSKNHIRYGYIEARCYIPNNIVLKTSFWTFGKTDPPDPYEEDEIDIYETKSPGDLLKERTIMQNCYHNKNDSNTISLLQQDVVFTDIDSIIGKWATYAVEWLPKEINFYVNGNITRCVKYSESYNSIESYFTCVDFEDAREQGIQFNMFVYNEVISYPDISDSLQIDWVRSYKLSEGFNYEYWPTNFSLSDPNMFKVHQSVHLAGAGHTATIPAYTQITVWATDGVVLDAGFEAASNTNFTARCITVSPSVFQ